MKRVLSIRRWFELPLTRGLDLDDPLTTELRKKIIQKKPLLREAYAQWYDFILRELPPGTGPILELGAGAGFLDTFLPEVLRSDIMPLRGLDMLCSGQALPVKDGSLRAIAMINVLHHLPDAAKFFAEAQRCLRPGGRILLVEPWMSFLSRFVYRHIHHEPCDPESVSWKFPVHGPLSSANEALPWILLKRDLTLFKQNFPLFSKVDVKTEINMCYFLSGGISMRAILPSSLGSMMKAIERAIQLVAPNQFALFGNIVLEKSFQNNK